MLSLKNLNLNDVPKILQQTDQMVTYLKDKGLMGEDGIIKV